MCPTLRRNERGVGATTTYIITLKLQKFNNCARHTYMHDHRQQTSLRITTTTMRVSCLQLMLHHTLECLCHFCAWFCGKQAHHVWKAKEATATRTRNLRVGYPYNITLLQKLLKYHAYRLYVKHHRIARTGTSTRAHKRCSNLARRTTTSGVMI